MNKVAEDINKLLNIRLVRHVTFWVAYILVMSYIHSGGTGTGNYFTWLANYGIELPVLAGLTYSITYLFIPYYLRVGKYLHFALFFLLTLLFFSALNVLLDLLVIIPGFFPEKAGEEVFSLRYILVNSFGLIFPVVIFVSISFARYINDKKQDETVLSQQLLQKQLEGIRNQMHPVFIRDVMNDLYIISGENTTMLPEMILKISDILHYLVYECNTPRISLRQEEQAIRKYLGFEQMIYRDYKVSINIAGNPENVQIAPYILFSLTRAVCIFQKGDIQSKDRVYIMFEISRKNLFFEASKIINEEQGNLDFEWKDEINLARKQLDSIYPWKYKLDVIETERKLSVNLNIEI